MPRFVRQPALLLILSLCFAVQVLDAGDVFRFRSRQPDYLQPAVRTRVRRQAFHQGPPTVPPPPPLRDCPCSSNPCLNGGVCISEPGSVPNTVDFNCICRESWNGTTCDVCLTGSPLCSNSCLTHRNNDICNDGGVGSYDDKCPAGTDCKDCFSRCI
ncbi:delta-like protein C [Patiria miniata]|uniref:EGF-like domain-containing protein n=1 Tax=Patiria miniata TaxID=46514 RepID=A0A914BLU0_PATMI|nr:delta-like protein C [Patiria miniata]XP_038076896.1 delta-like protein C [Patiria miniata]